MTKENKGVRSRELLYQNQLNISAMWIYTHHADLEYHPSIIPISTCASEENVLQCVDVQMCRCADVQIYVCTSRQTRYLTK